MRSDVEWYGREYVKNYEGTPMRHGLNKIFQNVMIHTKVSIRMFFSILELVPRPLYLSSILSWVLTHYCLADLPLFSLLRIATVQIDFLKERATW